MTKAESRLIGAALEHADPDNRYLAIAERLAAVIGLPYKFDGDNWTAYDQRHAELVEALQLGIAYR